MRVWGKRSPYTLSVGLKTGTASMEMWELLKNLQIDLSYHSAIILLSIYIFKQELLQTTLAWNSLINWEWPSYLVLLLPPKCWKYSPIPPHLASSGYITEDCKPAYHRCACTCTFIPLYLLPQTTHIPKLHVSQWWLMNRIIELHPTVI